MQNKIKIGDIYQDCAHHPIFCTESDEECVSGISLIDGTWPRSCSIRYCRPKKLSIAKAVKIKLEWESTITDELKNQCQTICDKFKCKPVSSETIKQYKEEMAQALKSFINGHKSRFNS